MSKTKEDFEKDVELDARLVLASTTGGIHGLANIAFALRDIFPKGPDQALARALWLKKQSEEYITKVSERAAELEK